jgi:diguanylate cyclase (GGDEF)-like protein
MIDIDHFKKVNDNYGHRVGDKVLKDSATRLKSNLRDSDLIARYGGEEIVVILDNTDYENSLKVAEKVLNTFSSKEYNVGDDLKVNVTASVGIASYPLHAKTVQELIEIADQTLYYAKENGRNQLATPDMLNDYWLGQSKKIQDSFKLEINMENELFEKIMETQDLTKKEEVAIWIYNKIKELFEEKSD